MMDFTRRGMLGVTAAAVAGAAASLPVATPASADKAADLDMFLGLSAALTGIAKSRLAPAVDPIRIASEYFNQASSQKGFAGLMQIVRDNPAVAAEKIMNHDDPDIKYLGRSIILAWYLGAWYEPETLKTYDSPHPGLFPVVPLKVISPKAYTQGWAWRVAQAHPMGYSELRFGYWSEDPPGIDDFIT